MADSTGHQSSPTSSAPIFDQWPDWWTSSLRAFRANRIAQRAEEREPRIAAIYGPIPSVPLAKWGPNGSYWRTCQASLLTDTPEPWSGKFPRSGMTVGGMLYPLPKLERPTAGNGGSALPIMPTPLASDAPDSGGPPNKNANTKQWGGVNSLGQMAKQDKWPTPAARDYRDSGTEPSQRLRHSPNLAATVMIEEERTADMTAMRLNPRWVEWLMGLPIGWVGITPMHRSDYHRWYRSTPGDWWQDEIDVARVCAPYKARTAEIKALGNGIVPATVARFLSMIGVSGLDMYLRRRILTVQQLKERPYA